MQTAHRVGRCPNVPLAFGRVVSELPARRRVCSVGLERNTAAARQRKRNSISLSSSPKWFISQTNPTKRSWSDTSSEMQFSAAASDQWELGYNDDFFKKCKWKLQAQLRTVLSIFFYWKTQCSHQLWRLLRSKSFSTCRLPRTAVGSFVSAEAKNLIDWNRILLSVKVDALEENGKFRLKFEDQNVVFPSNTLHFWFHSLNCTWMANLFHTATTAMFISLCWNWTNDCLWAWGNLGKMPGI